MIMRLICLIVILTCCGSSAAQNAAEAATDRTVETPVGMATNRLAQGRYSGATTSAAAPLVKHEFSLWRSMGSLLMVLGGLLAVTWFLKNRLGRTIRAGSHKRLQIVERLNVGQHQYLALINVDGDEMLVGISPNQITELGLTRKQGLGRTADQSYQTVHGKARAEVQNA